MSLPRPLHRPPQTDSQTASRRRIRTLGIALLLSSLAGAALVACGGGGGDTSTASDGTSSGTAPPPSTTAPDAIATPTTPTPTPVDTIAVPTTPAVAKVLNTALDMPWALAFLPDGRMLVTQRGGEMVVVSATGATVSGPIAGLPAVSTDGQGGLLDVAIDPDFDLATNPWVYWTYAEADNDGKVGTAVARGRLGLVSTGVSAGVPAGSLSAVTVIYRQTPKVPGGLQFGSRLAFRGDKTLLVTLGDRGQDSPEAPTADQSQSIRTTLGKVVRLQRDGSVPSDNPLAGTAGAQPEIWSLGHRNPQGAAIHPVSGDLWVTEHGPQGGDELNHVQAGRNYGWPLRSYGCPYSVDYSTVTNPVSCRVGGGTHAPSFTEPISFWMPKSIAPSGLVFYTGSKFPEWKNNVLMGALNSYDTAGYPEIKRGLWRIVLNGDSVVSRERLTLIDERVRDVRQGPDGWVYLLTDSGQLVRIER